MEQITQNNKLKNILYMLAGLGGISLVIIIHEMGHFLCAQFFGVATPIFSLGFGPALYSLHIGKTLFQFSLLPFGGYVEMDPHGLAAQPYLAKILIISAGIIFNLIFAYCIFIYYAFCKQLPTEQTTSNNHSIAHALKTCHEHYTTTMTNIGTAASQALTQNNQRDNIIGPIGIISMIGKSLAISPRLFWLMVAIISLNVGLFNILPLPFFDGGKALIFTIEALLGRPISPEIIWYITIIFLTLFIFFITTITKNDIKRLWRK